MMRKVLIGVVAVAALALIGSWCLAGEEGAWLDPAGCYMCKPLTQQEGLLDHSTWENHPISNGIVSVTTVEDGYLDKMRAASKAMENNWKTMEPGKEYHLCGMCQAWMDAWDESIKMESIETMHGSVDITTSDNPETVKKLHAIAQRTTEEMKKYMDMEMPKGHEE